MSAIDDLGVERLRIDFDQAGKDGVIRLYGELDLAGVERVRDALRRVQEDDEARATLLDIDKLEFIDSEGLALLVELSRSDGAEPVKVTRGSGRVAELLRLTGVDEAIRSGR
jgi:anti-anti-sigma factor